MRRLSTRIPALLPGLLAILLVLTGCTSAPEVNLPTPAPGESRIDVDTPQLRTLKERAGVAECVPGADAAVDGGLPDVTLPCLGGGADVNLSTLRGPMIVNLWASTCGPCRREMPILQAFHQKYDGQVAVLGIDYQDPQTEGALQLVRRTGVTYPLLADPGGELQDAAPLRVLGLPTMVFVDATGEVAHVQAVEVTSEQELVDLVDEHLGLDL